MCASVCVLSYMVDIKLYPSFHQLSEEESSSEALQSEPGVHVNVCTLKDTAAGQRQRCSSHSGSLLPPRTSGAVGFSPEKHTKNRGELGWC